MRYCASIDVAAFALVADGKGWRELYEEPGCIGIAGQSHHPLIHV